MSNKNKKPNKKQNKKPNKKTMEQLEKDLTTLLKEYINISIKNNYLEQINREYQKRYYDNQQELEKYKEKEENKDVLD